MRKREELNREREGERQGEGGGGVLKREGDGECV